MSTTVRSIRSAKQRQMQREENTVDMDLESEDMLVVSVWNKYLLTRTKMLMMFPRTPNIPRTRNMIPQIQN